MIRRPPRSTRTDTTLSLHDALPISGCSRGVTDARSRRKGGRRRAAVSGNRPRGIAPENRPVEGRRENDRRSEEHTSELQSLMRISYAVFCLQKKNTTPHVVIYAYQIGNSHTHVVTKTST